MSVYPPYEKQFLEDENARIGNIEAKWKILYKQRAELKMDFKAGKFTQQEYMYLREPVTDDIQKLLAEKIRRYPFSLFFKDEIGLCSHKMNAEELIRHIVNLS